MASSQGPAPPYVPLPNYQQQQPGVAQKQGQQPVQYVYQQPAAVQQSVPLTVGADGQAQTPSQPQTQPQGQQQQAVKYVVMPPQQISQQPQQ